MGDQVTTKFFAGGAGGSGGLHRTSLALLPSDCSDNPCDPYCQNYVDDPSGTTPPPGFTDVDGGWGVIGGSGGIVPGAVQTTANGDSTCTPMLNVHSDPCSATPLSSCQQDFRCDTATDTCIWNGGEGYYDPNAGGPDLTIGAACDIGWGEIMPVCNRGSTAIAEGSPINIFITNPPTPPDGCAPIADVPSCTQPVPAGGLAPGSCMNVVCTVPGNKFVIVNPANPGAVVEAPGHCANNGAFATIEGTPGCATCQSCNTVVTGHVKDPGMSVGLSGITVFEPNQPLAAIADNVGGATRPPCDTCESLLDPATFSTGVNTAVDGSFTLQNVTPGHNRQIVAQTGRWRRVVTLDIPACQTTALPDDQIRMPRNRAEGDIPKMALVEGQLEALSCWLLKVGIDENEIWPRGGVAPGDAVANQARIQIYRTNGLMQSAPRPQAPPDTQLWQTNDLNEFSAVILPCDGGTAARGSAPSAADTAAMAAYANAGGRIFMNHRRGSDEWLHQDSGNAPPEWDNPNISTWQAVSTTWPAIGYIFGAGGAGNVAQQTFRNWMANWAPFPGPTPPPGAGWLNVDSQSPTSLVVGDQVTEFVRGRADNVWPPPPYSDATTGVTVCSGSGPGCSDTSYTYSLSFSFDTSPTLPPSPMGGAGYCGRVIYNGMHVAGWRVVGITPGNYIPDTNTFPTSCDLSFALTPEERALEYQFFQLAACALGSGPALPPPPSPPTLPSQSFTRDYQAVCASGYRPEWEFFSWQAEVPSGATIDFQAQTAAAQEDLATAPMVGAGSAIATTATWTSDPNTVEYHLEHDIPSNRLTSQSWLRITMNFNPNGPVSPILTNWRQTFDCIPAE